MNDIKGQMLFSFMPQEDKTEKIERRTQMEIGNEIKKAQYWKDMEREFMSIVENIMQGMTPTVEQMKRINNYRRTLAETPRNGTL
jgi:hypothetical protein